MRTTPFFRRAFNFGWGTAAVLLAACQTSSTQWNAAGVGSSSEAGSGSATRSLLDTQTAQVLGLATGRDLAGTAKEPRPPPSPDDLGHFALLPKQETTALSLPEDLIPLLVDALALNTKTGTCLMFEGQQNNNPQQHSWSISIPFPKGQLSAEGRDAVGLGPSPESATIVIFDREKQAAVGFGFPNDQGRFECATLPAQPGFGYSGQDLLEQESLPNAAGPGPRETKEIVLRRPPRARARIATGGDENKLLLLRIAEERSGFAFSLLEEQKDWNTGYTGWNWTVKNRTSSPGLRVASYYRQSFLVSAKSLEVSLKPGRYAFALVDPITLDTCINVLDLVESLPAEGGCPKWRNPALAKESDEVLLVTTNSNEEIISDQLSLLRSRGLSIGELVLSGDAASVPSGIKQHKAGESAASKAFAQRVEGESLILDGSFADLGGIGTSEISGLEPYLSGTEIPTLVIASGFGSANKGKQTLSPLVTQTRIRADSRRALSADSVLTSVTNGVTFTWQSAQPSSSLLPIPTDGLVGFTVQIPAYNLTEFIEIHVNGRLWRRLVIDRKDFTKPLLVPVEEQFDLDTDFQMTLLAWGRAYLPEFIHGRENVRPRAILSRFCFDVNKNAICDHTLDP